MSFEMAWAFPKFDGIVLVMHEEFVKIREDGCWLDLVGMDGRFEDFSCCMNRVGGDNNFWHVIKI